MFRKIWIPTSLYQPYCLHSLDRIFRIHTWAKASINTTAWPCIWKGSLTHCCTWIRTAVGVISRTKGPIWLPVQVTLDLVIAWWSWLVLWLAHMPLEPQLLCSAAWATARIMPSTKVHPSTHITTLIVFKPAPWLLLLPNPPWFPKPLRLPPSLSPLSVYCYPT